MFSGNSDPYVKVKMGEKLIYRSRVVYKSLNPRWMESFSVSIPSRNTALRFIVRDYNVASTDVYMGEAAIQPSQLEPDK